MTQTTQSFAQNLKTLTASVLLAAGLLSAGTADAAPKSEPWALWEAHDAQATKSIDHGTWDRLLDAYLEPKATGPNLFAYGRVTPEDAQALETYIRDLEATPISTFSRAEQLPYWLNFYNALTIKVILDHWPTKTILDIDLGGGGLFSNGPWDRELVMVEGTDLSLNDIEHRILRPIWDAPMIHYGVNCASIGCPNLAGDAFTAENVQRLLVDGAKAFVNSPRGARIEADGDLVVSKIYDWFQEDFDDSEEGVITHLMKFARPELREQLQGRDSIDDFEYDWSINSVGSEAAQTAQTQN